MDIFNIKLKYIEILFVIENSGSRSTDLRCINFTIHACLDILMTPVEKSKRIYYQNVLTLLF